MFYLAKRITTELSWEGLFCQKVDSDIVVADIGKTIVTYWPGFIVISNSNAGDLDAKGSPL